MKTYACTALNEQNQCIAYIEQANFIAELSQLTYAQAGELLTWTAAILGSAWLWKHLSLTARRG